MGMRNCLPCHAGYDWECWYKDDKGNPCENKTANVDIPVVKREPGRPKKSKSEIKDLQSTGRKRAAEIYPISDGMICEWKGLANAGGGIEPIVGCIGNPVTDRHHGPDKSTLNNEFGNVHRICAKCHNRWHARNDKHYIGDRPSGDKPWTPQGDNRVHDRETRATQDQILENETKWVKSKRK